MQLHWIHPANPDGSAWRGVHGRKTASPPFDFAAAFQPGTKANQELMRDLKGHADYLQQLADARVPVLWRPLHEIDGGWFWWTDKETPENTAQLWRVMFDYFVKERKLHNLIWVYSASLRCGKGREGVENVAMRKRFYPGDAYVDIAGIDIYPSDYIGLGKPQTDTYAKSFEAMKQVVPGKMLALCECEAIPNPDMMAKDGPKWLYCLPWWTEGKRHPAEWIRNTYLHEQLLTLDDLPKWKVTQ
jgi:mannan endo-1,4-beta-mannosidase